MLDYQAPPDLLNHSVILVTGASDGIGREAAFAFARHGAALVLLGRNQEKLDAVAASLVADGHQPPLLVCLDLQQAVKRDYRLMAEQIDRRHGRLDGLLLNAGLLGSLCPVEQIDEAEWDAVMQVNVKSQLLMLQACLPLLRRSSAASVILTSSGVGKKGRALWGSYAVSKFATEGLMQVLADELKETPIRVNCINPGATRTRMRAAACPDEDPTLLRTPAQLMPLYLYLMGHDSLSVRGQSLDAQPKPAAPRST